MLTCWLSICTYVHIRISIDSCDFGISNECNMEFCFPYNSSESLVVFLNLTGLLQKALAGRS